MPIESKGQFVTVFGTYILLRAAFDKNSKFNKTYR